MRIERGPAATRGPRQQAREWPARTQRKRQHAGASHEREQRAHLHGGRLRAAVAGDLEQLAILHVRRAGRLAGAAAEAAIERLARLLDGQIAGHQALHDVDPASRAVRFGGQQVERRAVREAEAARDALAGELVEALAPRIRQIDRRHARAASTTAATSSGLAGGAARTGASASRAAGVTSARRLAAS